MLKKTFGVLGVVALLIGVCMTTRSTASLSFFAYGGFIIFISAYSFLDQKSKGKTTKAAIINIIVFIFVCLLIEFGSVYVWAWAFGHVSG